MRCHAAAATLASNPWTICGAPSTRARGTISAIQSLESAHPLAGGAPRDTSSPACNQGAVVRPVAALDGLRSTAIATPLEAFVSYSHRDEKLRMRLDNQLSALKRQGLVATWNDRRIGAGADLDREISSHLETADLVLLLISAEFIASDYCWGQEMMRALARHAAGETRVIPIILRHCDWQYTPFGKLAALPTDGRPVAGSSWPNIAAALQNVAEGVRKVVNDLIATVEQAHHL